MCCAKCSDGAWYRAIVTKVLPDRQVIAYLDISVHSFHNSLNQESLLINTGRQDHGKVLLNSFHLNGHTLRFHPQT